MCVLFQRALCKDASPPLEGKPVLSCLTCFKKKACEQAAHHPDILFPHGTIFFREDSLLDRKELCSLYVVRISARRICRCEEIPPGSKPITRVLAIRFAIPPTTKKVCYHEPGSPASAVKFPTAGPPAQAKRSFVVSAPSSTIETSTLFSESPRRRPLFYLLEISQIIFCEARIIFRKPIAILEIRSPWAFRTEIVILGRSRKWSRRSFALRFDLAEPKKGRRNPTKP